MLNEFQKQAFIEEAEELEVEKVKEGYLPTDLVALGYYLVKNNVDKAEELERKLLEADELIRRADELINNYK